MRFIRYQQGGQAPRLGWVFNELVGPVEGDIFGDFRRLEATIPLLTVRLVAPLEPGKIIAIGRNFVDPIHDRSSEAPEVPMIFLKPSSAVIGPDQKILLPPQSRQVEHEGELAAVIGKAGRWISPDDVAKYILGYTVANDITARDLQRRDGQWTRAKGFDTFCPLGPWIETEFDPTDAMVTCHVNGQMRQMASTRDMVFSINQLIAFISSIMTLNPGDVVLTGSPAGSGILTSGDVVEVAVEGIGALRNPVAAGTAA